MTESKPPADQFTGPMPDHVVTFQIRFVLQREVRRIRREATPEDLDRIAAAVADQLHKSGLHVVKRPRVRQPGERGHAANWPEDWTPPPPKPPAPDWTLD